jgi:hypothetical protein
MRILKSEHDGDLRLKCCLNLHELYRDLPKKPSLSNDLDKCLEPLLQEKLFSCDGRTLRYASEQLIPTKVDRKPALLLVLGKHCVQQKIQSIRPMRQGGMP